MKNCTTVQNYVVLRNGPRSALVLVRHVRSGSLWWLPRDGRFSPAFYNPNVKRLGQRRTKNTYEIRTFPKSEQVAGRTERNTKPVEEAELEESEQQHLVSAQRGSSPIVDIQRQGE